MKTKKPSTAAVRRQAKAEGEPVRSEMREMGMGRAAKKPKKRGY